MAHRFKKVVTASFSGPEMWAGGFAGLTGVFNEVILQEFQYQHFLGFSIPAFTGDPDLVIRQKGKHAFAVRG